MALVVADRVQETTNTTGTGTLTLAGAVTGFQSFAAIGNANTTYYAITSGTDWEVGLGTYTSVGTTLSRDTVLASSAAGAKITVAAGASVFGTYPAGRAVYRDASGNVGIGMAPTGLDLLELAAGTTALAPLGFTAGALLTTPDPGSVEYDGTAWYFTPTGTARALTPVAYYYRKNTATTLASATGNQSIFGLTNGVTVAANTTYEVELEFELTTTGTTSHTESFGFALTTATVTNMGVTVNRLSASTTSSALGAYLTSATPVVVTGALTTAQTVVYRVKGTIAVGTGGSINPVLAFSAAPAGTSTVVLGAWMKLTPIGATGSNVAIGTWA